MCRILFVLPDILLFRSVVFPLFFKLHFLVPFYFMTFVPTISLVVNFERAFPNDITAAMLVPSRIKLYSYTNEPFNFWLLKNGVREQLTVLFSLSFQPIVFLRSVVLLLFLRLQSSFRFYCVDFVKPIEAFLHDVKVAILKILHKEKAGILVSQTHPSRIELYFYATTSCRLGNTSMCKLIIFHIIVLFRGYLVVPFYNIGSSLFLRLCPDAPLYCILFISAKPSLCWAMRRFSLHDVTAAMLLLRNKEKAAMLVPQTPSTIEFLMLRISFRAKVLEINNLSYFFSAHLSPMFYSITFVSRL